MTIKLFWDDPYLTTCTAVVTSIDVRVVKLDRTIFYAFSGGQESDTGTIGGISVLEAHKQGDKESIIDIDYTLAEVPLFRVGDTVEVVIDAAKRDRLRRLHSAAHLLYYSAIFVLGPIKIVGSNVGMDKARMDFSYELPLVEKIALIEEAVNSVISSGVAIVMKNDEEKADLRWWTCGEHKMPCGGTHVRNVSEIGPLRLARVNKGKGKERIEIFLTS